MPTYEYQCNQCGERTEAEQRFTDPPLTTCSQCGGDLRKVFSAVGVVFKGSGFYKTDSRPSGASGPKAEKPAAKEGGDGATAPAKAKETAPSSPAPASSD